MENESGSEDDSSSKVYLRKASLHDINDVLRIYKLSREFLDDEDDDWFRNIIRSRSRRVGIYILKTGDGFSVGFALVYRYSLGRSVYIDSLAIDPGYRGMGFGKAMLNLLEKLFRDEGFEKIYLTVKHSNLRALSLYLKSGYRIRNIVLILGIDSIDKLPGDEDFFDNDYSYKIYVNTRRGIGIRRKIFLESAVWNRFTGDPDEAIYERSREKRIIIKIYKGRRIVGVASISIERNQLLIERLALVFNDSSITLMYIMRVVKRILEEYSYRISNILIPVDASKNSILNTLLNTGFRIVDTEYVVVKDLRETSS